MTVLKLDRVALFITYLPPISLSQGLAKSESLMGVILIFKECEIFVNEF